ncbi:MAG: hypothetical protein GXY15_15120 [Candidatus Hydrogenedentes bacterium]|nr:hypothetical protein [Candidatus Hydrogenedentota bacterium]
MKKMLVGLIALAVALVGAPALAQYTPVPDLTGCPAAGQPGLPFSPLPTFNIMDANYAAPALSWPAVGEYDFCAILDTVFCSAGPLGDLAEEVEQFAFLIQCLNADINGPLNPDPEADIPVQPNGIPDGQYELGLLGRVLNTPSNPYHDAALAAFQSNTLAIKAIVVEALANASFKKSDEKDIRALVGGIVPHLLGSLCSVLGAFPTLGDATTNAALDELLGLLEGIGVDAPDGGIGAITTAVPQLGPEGDADGDGASNRKEYNYFKAQGPAATIDAQLDPLQTPPNLAFVTGAGKFEEGTTVTLRIAFVGMTGEGATFQWFKGGAPITDATGSSLVFDPVTVADAGSYSCELNIPDKATVFLTDPAVLTVLPEGSLPVAGGMGLALLAGACALAGAVGIRRRK